MKPESRNCPCPCFVLEESSLVRNLEVFDKVIQETGATILLALKGFSLWPMFGLIGRYLAGGAASSLFEARLCNEGFQRKAHTYMVAFPESDFDEIVRYSSHLNFNSLQQWRKFSPRVPADVEVGLRINPLWSNTPIPKYDPTSCESRLGAHPDTLPPRLPDGINGLHFHALCEAGLEDLFTLLDVIERSFSAYLRRVAWVNLGGGLLVTRRNFDVERMAERIHRFKRQHQVEVFLEPGSAVAWNTGFLSSRVLDIVRGKNDSTAILNISFACHLPDTLEMPYQPRIEGSSKQEDAVHKFGYRMGGGSCLAVDFLPKYWFQRPLEIDTMLCFQDAMHYTIVKSTMFNGLGHPGFALKSADGTFRMIREFAFEDYRNRNG